MYSIIFKRFVESSVEFYCYHAFELIVECMLLLPFFDNGLLSRVSNVFYRYHVLTRLVSKIECILLFS